MACVGALLATPKEAVKGLLKPRTARVKGTAGTLGVPRWSHTVRVSVHRSEAYIKAFHATTREEAKEHLDHIMFAKSSAANGANSHIHSDKVVKSGQQSSQEGKSQA